MDEQKENWVCPNCGNNDDISEKSLAWVSYRGQFYDAEGVGHVQMFDTETPEIEDNPSDPYTYYVCNGCGNEFDEPITTEEYEAQNK